MFANLARIDIERLRREGFALTDEDVIELNDLAVRVESGKEKTAANHPRFAFAGNVVLHEPTVAALEWWWQYGHDAGLTAAAQLRVHFFMLAHARRPEVFDSLTTPREICRAVRAWYKRVAATEAELMRALLYVKRATNDPGDEAMAEPDEDEMLDRLTRLLADVAGAVGVAPAALRGNTRCELEALMVRAFRAGEVPKPSTAKLYFKYRAKVAEIRARGKAAQNVG